MESELQRILDSTCNSVVDGSFTHVSLYGPRGRYRVTDRQKFWQGYCDLIEDIPDGNICLAERSKDDMPVIFHFRFKFHNNIRDEEDLYTDKLLHVLIFCAQNAIEEGCKIDETRREFAFVAGCLESNDIWRTESDNSEKEFSTEIRLHFPYCKVNVHFQQKVLRDKIIRNLRKYNALSNLTSQPSIDWEDIIDPNVLSNPLLMYGSNDVPGKPKLEITGFYNRINEDNLDDDEYEILPIKLDGLFIPANHLDCYNRTVEASFFEEHDLEYYLPMFFSIHYWGYVTDPKESELQMDDRKTKESFKLKSQREREPNLELSDNSNLDLSQRFMLMMDPNRFKKKVFWYDLGKALFTSCKEDKIAIDNGLKLWISFTEKNSLGYSAIECNEYYDNLVTSYVSVKTLAYYAREDSPEKYKKWHNKWVMESMEKALTTLHTDVAECFYRIYWLDFISCPCGKTKSNKFYYFDRSRWCEISQAVTIRKYISNEFSKKFEGARADICNNMKTSTDDTERARSEEIIKKITNLVAKLKNAGYKGLLVKELVEFFFFDKFEEVCDMDPYILGILGGVLQFTDNEAIYRKGKPEDYITKCTGCPYRQEYTWDSPLVKEVMVWMSQVFPDDELKDYFLKFASSCLKGMNSDKLFPIFSGKGDNSKSMIVKLFEAMLRCYCIKFPTSVATGKRTQSSQATPELERARSARLAFLQEPDDEEVLNKGVTKGLTGGDSYYSRGMFRDGGDVVAMFKLILMCNNIPVFTNPDKAIKNRTAIFPFLSTWVKNAPKSIEEQYRTRTFQMDVNFEKRIPILAPAFLWICVQYYPLYCRDGLISPKIVEETTKEYFESIDIYNNFISDRIEQAKTMEGNPDINSKLSLTEIYREFKLWYKDSMPSCKMIDRSTVRSELILRWGKPSSNNTWHCIKFIQTGNVDMSKGSSGMDVNRILNM